MSDPTEPQTVTLIDPDGNPKDAPAADVPRLLRRGFTVESNQQHVDRVVGQAKDEVYGTPLGKVGAFAAGVNRAVTFGGSDALGAAIDPDQARHYKNLREVNPISSAAGEVAGTLATAIPTGGESAVAAQGISKLPGAAVGRLGAGIAEAGEGANVLSRIGHAAAGGAVEGAIYGAGGGVGELAIQDDPVTLEHAIGTISSHALYGGAIGGAAGSLGKLAEIGLTKGRAAIDGALAARESHAVTDDLAAMDSKQLGIARKTELESLKADHATETEAVEATRVTERKSIADDIKSLRQEIKDSEQWATTKDLKMPSSGEGRLTSNQLGRDAMDSEKALARSIKNPIALAENPKRALDALQQNEHTLTQIIDHGDELRAAYAADGLGGKRLAALDRTPQLLEKNQALQARIREVTQPHAPVPTSSPRIEAIDAAKDALSHGGGHGGLSSIPQHMLEGSVFGMVSSAAHAIPVVGPLASHLLGAAAAKFVGEKVFGRLGEAAAGGVARTAKAVSAFLEPATAVTRAATPIASKVLANVRFGAMPANAKADTGPSSLPALFKRRTDEVKAQTQYMADGSVQMRPDARAAVAERLKPIAALSPVIADRFETIAAKRLEFLATRIPRKPDVFAPGLGPDLWQPSDMEMRKWARYVAGVEHPHDIIDRVAHGVVSPEDGEVMREVYPEMLGDLQRQIVEQSSGTTGAKAKVGYQRRRALSVLTGVPMDPSMDPRILNVLQNSFAAETGTGGGTQAPRAQPNYGAMGSASKSLDGPTPAQKRSAG